MKKNNSFVFVFCVSLGFMISACGGVMTATKPISSSTATDSSAIYDGQMKRQDWWGGVTPFSSSMAPENQDDGAIPASAPAASVSAAPAVAQPGAPTKPVAQPGSKDFDPSTLAPGSKKEDFVAKGLLTPTVYYKPIFNEDQDKCSADEKVNLRGVNNAVLATVCPKAKDACDLQGSCMIQQNGKITSYNYVDQTVKGYPHFSVVDLNVCPFGLGVRESCLDPFYNVAADMDYFKAGDVIFVPALVGLALPGGMKHTGFLIVRDSGGGIDGNNRFDFFSGFYDWRDSTNPFNKLKLTDKSTKIPYYQVKGATALTVQAARNDPSRPGCQKVVAPTVSK